MSPLSKQSPSASRANPDEGQGVLKIYAGKKGLMHSSRDIPHPLALALPMIHRSRSMLPDSKHKGIVHCQARALRLHDVQVVSLGVVLPGDEGQGVLKIYAGKKGLMHSSRDIPHPLALYCSLPGASIAAA
jgi:hypothetical protein